MVMKMDPDQIEWMEVNLGTENCNILKTLTKEDIRFYSKLLKSLDLRTSYYVKGSETQLSKFKAIYLSRCNNIKEVRKHDEFMFSDYAKYLAGTSEDDIGIPEVLFIRAHSHGIGYGKTEEWLSSVLVDNLANRRIKGYVTIILSERDIPDITNTNELEYIDLTKGITKKKGVSSSSHGSEYL